MLSTLQYIYKIKVTSTNNIRKKEYSTYSVINYDPNIESK